MGPENIGRILLYLGGFLLLVGGLFYLCGKLGLGRLPGDIYVERENFVFYFPLATAIVVSLLLTLLFNLILRR